METALPALSPLAALALALIAAPALAQTAPDIAPGLAFADAAPLLDGACAAQQRFDVAPTLFPDAADSETHILCQGYTLTDGTAAGDAVFTFADERLVAIETRGAVDAIRPDADPVAELGGFAVYMPGNVVIRAGTQQAFRFDALDLAWMALAWDNPVWHGNSPAADVAPFHIPAIVAFGASLEDVQAIAAAECALAPTREIADVWLRTEPARQTQIDCFGPIVAGYPRKLELVFGDGQLEQVWLLLGTADVPRLRSLMTARYGAPIHVDAQYEVFDNWRIALRKDRPELLIGSERLAAIWAREGF